MGDMAEAHESANRSMPVANDTNPRWHLVNLVPIWILQCIITIVMGVLPSFCIMSCGSPTAYVTSFMAFLVLTSRSKCVILRAQRLAINSMLLSMLATAAEVSMFACKSLTPARNILFQGIKSILSVGQIIALVVQDFRYASGELWAPMLIMATIFSPIW